MPTIAFKEWAVVCRALAEGHQSVILRKGGIAETGGRFRPEHGEFLLYPTYFHEHRECVKAAFRHLFELTESDRPPPGWVRLTHFVRVTDTRLVTDLSEVLALDGLHIWTEEVVRQRFHYRTPGLFVLHIRTFPLREPMVLAERAEYAGCKSWVHLTETVALT